MQLRRWAALPRTSLDTHLPISSLDRAPSKLLDCANESVALKGSAISGTPLDFWDAEVSAASGDDEIDVQARRVNIVRYRRAVLPCI